MEMPDIPKVFFLFPPRYACGFIAIGGMALGGCGLAVIIFYQLVEAGIGKGIVPKDAELKRLVMAGLGFASLLLLISNILLFLGTSSGSKTFLGISKWIYLATVLVLLFVCSAAPLLCYFKVGKCLIKQMSTVAMTAVYLVMYCVVSLTLYCAVVVHNCQIRLR